MTNTLRFFFNGIKGTDGKLQKCSYSAGSYTEASGIPAGTITLYGKGYRKFSAEVCAAFEVKNDSDPYTDYVVNDTIRVTPSHPLFPAVKAAFDKSEARNAERYANYLKRAA